MGAIELDRRQVISATAALVTSGCIPLREVSPLVAVKTEADLNIPPALTDGRANHYSFDYMYGWSMQEVVERTCTASEWTANEFQDVLPQSLKHFAEIHNLISSHSGFSHFIVDEARQQSELVRNLGKQYEQLACRNMRDNKEAKKFERSFARVSKFQQELLEMPSSHSVSRLSQSAQDITNLLYDYAAVAGDFFKVMGKGIDQDRASLNAYYKSLGMSVDVDEHRTRPEDALYEIVRFSLPGADRFGRYVSILGRSNNYKTRPEIEIDLLDVNYGHPNRLARTREFLTKNIEVCAKFLTKSLTQVVKEAACSAGTRKALLDRIAKHDSNIDKILQLTTPRRFFTEAPERIVDSDRNLWLEASYLSFYGRRDDFYWGDLSQLEVRAPTVIGNDYY